MALAILLEDPHIPHILSTSGGLSTKKPKPRNQLVDSVAPGSGPSYKAKLGVGTSGNDPSRL